MVDVLCCDARHLRVEPPLALVAVEAEVVMQLYIFAIMLVFNSILEVLGTRSHDPNIESRRRVTNLVTYTAVVET